MTPLEQRALDYVREHIARAGFAPSVRETGERIGLRSSNGAHRVLSSLVAQGLLRKTGSGARNLALADQPDLQAVPTDLLRAELARRGMTLEALQRPARRARPAMGRDTARCAADTCCSPVQRGHLFCRPHWFSLPDDLRGRILAAFGAGDADAYQDAVAEARDRVDGCAQPFRRGG